MRDIYQRIYDEWNRATRTLRETGTAGWINASTEDRYAATARLLPLDVVEAIVERADQYNPSWTRAITAELDRRRQADRWWT